MREPKLKFETTCPWLFGPRRDLLFFVCPVVVAALSLLLFHNSPLRSSQLFLALLLTGFGVGPFHFGITWFHYFDRLNSKHYASAVNYLWAIVLPAVLFIAAIVGVWYVPNLVIFVYLIWNAQHITQQNIGILLLYHNQGGDEAIVDRKVEVASLHAATAFFNFLFLSRLVAAGSWSTVAVQLLTAFIGLECLWLACQYVRQLRRQLRGGKSLNLPATAFWALSMLFFAPVGLFATTYNEGLLISLFAHWLQYIGLNAVLIGRKYGQSKNNRLFILNRHPFLLFTLIGCAGAVLMMPSPIMVGAHFCDHSWQLRIATGVFMGLTVVHYFQDMFIWRFREQFNRDSLLVYLKPGRSAVSAKESSPNLAKIPVNV